MTFIRPEIRAQFWRWREALIGAGAGALGVWWIFGPGGLLGWVGWLLVLVATALIVIGIQRARFRQNDEGPGVVRVDEGQITYFGPLTGGTVAARDLERLTYDPRAHPPHWVLNQPGQKPLSIPVNAAGSEVLFDVFATLPGLKTERMLNQMQGGGVHPVVIWERRPLRPEGHRLH